MHKLSKEAFVMVVNCLEAHKIYGVTVDKISRGKYSLIWAFPLNEKQAKNEGFGKDTVKGSLEKDTEYPGCPYCGGTNLLFCECGTVMCWHGQKVVTCPKCKTTGEVTGIESVSMRGGAM